MGNSLEQSRKKLEAGRMTFPRTDEFYDALSRKRALTEAESLLLEKAIKARSRAERRAEHHAARKARA